MCGSQMVTIFCIGKHPNVKFGLYWASKRFVDPGLYMWWKNRSRRVLPVSKLMLP